MTIMEELTAPKHLESFSDWRNEAYLYLGVLVWPFGVMMAALRFFRKPWAKNMFWIFCIFFGYTFIIAQGNVGSADSARYSQMLVEYSIGDMGFAQLWDSFYSESSSYVDIAQPIITYMVSRFTENPRILFAVFGLVFGFFYSRNIWYVLDRIKGRMSLVLVLYVLTFALFNPIWNINGVRMWTAAQIFLFGALPYLLEGKIKNLLWSGIAIFFHFSFMLPFAVLLLFAFVRNRIGIFMILFILTSFIKEINLESVQSALSFLPAIFQLRVSGYTNLEYASALTSEMESVNWYIAYSAIFVKWAIYIISLFIYLAGRSYLEKRKDLKTLFCFSLLFYSFANIFSLVPSGSRFLIIASALMFAFYILYFDAFPAITGYMLVQTLTLPLIALFCVVAIRMGMDYFGLTTVLGNPLFAIFDNDPVPLITGIKNLF